MYNAIVNLLHCQTVVIRRRKPPDANGIVVVGDLSFHMSDDLTCVTIDNAHVYA
jgi:hypothetical protein